MNTETLIADRFAEVLRAWLTPQEFAEMKRLNETPEYQSGICASHNYCDANMAMCEAFESVMEYPPDGSNEAHAAIWNAAWDLARKRHLGTASPN